MYLQESVIQLKINGVITGTVDNLCEVNSERIKKAKFRN